MPREFRPGLYRHFKGGAYRALFRATDANGDGVVVYRDYNERIWTRSLDSFMGEVKDGEEQVNRFEEIEDPERELLNKMQELATEVICDICTNLHLVEVDSLEGEHHLSVGDDGTWVRAWVLVPNDRLEKAGLKEKDEE